MTYSVKEIFYTLQGEGANAGRAAVFCRFSGCNLWSGREEDRATAICTFCDTEFVGVDGVGGGKFATAAELADAIASKWPSTSQTKRLVVLTGGEPLLQVDKALTAELHLRNFEIAVETNGTVPIPEGLDWICVSPKAGSTVVVRSGSELKVVFPQLSLAPSSVEDWDFQHFLIQPMDGPDHSRNISLAVSYCQANPKWRLSLQTHKILGIR